MTHGMVAMVWDRGWTPSSCQDLEQSWDSTGCAWAVSPSCSPSLNSASSTAHELGGQTHSRDKPPGTLSQLSPGALSPGPAH